MKKFFLIVSFLSITIILTGCVPGYPSNIGTGSANLSGVPGMIQCYLVEESYWFKLKRASYRPNDVVTYIRVYADAYIPAYKIRVTTRYVGKNIQDLEEKSSSVRGTEIHEYTALGNWEMEPMDEFLLVKLEGEGISSQDSRSSQIPFDVYVDKQVIDDNRLPEFVTNCQPRGGTTMVMVPPAGSPQTEMPNQFFEKSKIDHSPAGYEVDQNYNQVESEGRLYQYYVKIGKVPKIPDESEGAIPIGKIEMDTASESKTYDIFFHLDILYLVEQTNRTEIYQYEGTNDFPQTLGSTAKTLKLETIRFVNLYAWNWYTPECKPVIYFYPQKDQYLSLWVYPRGFLTLTEPEYQNGWENLWIEPSGRIFYKGRFYPYLHYEAMIGDFVPPKTGYVVKKENLPSFFDEILPKVGLNQKEAKDFKDYWLSRLTNSPYFQISILSQKEIDEIEPIVFSQNPDTFIRVRFYFKGLNSPIKIPPPQISSLPQRTGFVIVEWGGLYE